MLECCVSRHALEPPPNTPLNQSMKLLGADIGRAHVRHTLLTVTTLNNGCLGSRNDEERSEMRYVV